MGQNLCSQELKSVKQQPEISTEQKIANKPEKEKDEMREDEMHEDEMHKDEMPKDEIHRHQVTSPNPENISCLTDLLHLEVQPLYNAIQLSSSQVQVIPIMVSVDTQGKSEELAETFLKKRPAVDLVCVIDESGSMQGTKIDLVKQTLLYVLEILNERDRLSLILFSSGAKQACPLLNVNSENKVRIAKLIKDINPQGGTHIFPALTMAASVLKQSENLNTVSSIFLLSDGQENIGISNIDDELNMLNLGPSCTIHSFGFGQDHDPEIMNAIAKHKDGNFYFVENIEQVDEMFVEALGGLFSVIGQNLELRVQVNSNNGVLNDVMISKAYGNQWKTVEENKCYSLKVIQLYQGVTKNYMLELSLPPVSKKIADNERNVVLLKANLQVSPLSGQKGDIVKQSSDLKITLYNQDEQMPRVAENDDVKAHLIRVQIAEQMLNCQVLFDQGHFVLGIQELKQMKNKILTSEPVVQKNLYQTYMCIDDQMRTCNPLTYMSSGKKKLMSQQRSQMEQRSIGYNTSQTQCGSSLTYDNHIQRNMVQQLQDYKQSQKSQKRHSSRRNSKE